MSVPDKAINRVAINQQKLQKGQLSKEPDIWYKIDQRT